MKVFEPDHFLRRISVFTDVGVDTFIYKNWLQMYSVSKPSENGDLPPVVAIAIGVIPQFKGKTRYVYLKIHIPSSYMNCF